MVTHKYAHTKQNSLTHIVLSRQCKGKKFEKQVTLCSNIHDTIVYYEISKGVTVE